MQVNKSDVASGLFSSYQDALKGGENPATRLNLALAYYKLSEFGRAAQEFDTVRTEESANVQASELAANCYLRLGDNRRVIAITTPLALARPDDLALQYLLGAALLRDHQTEQGRQIINRILAHGESGGSDLLQAQVALADQDYSKANALTEPAIGQAPKLADAHVLNGIAKEGLGDYVGARSAFEQALRLDPTAFDANLHLSALMLRESDTASAERFAAAALRLRTSSAAELYQMGLIHRATGKFEDAVANFEAAEKQSPEWLEPHVQLATLYYRVQRPADGQREREQVSRLSAYKPAAAQPE